jgi:hypothetical protein
MPDRCEECSAVAKPFQGPQDQRGMLGKLVAAGFAPAFNLNEKILLAVFERGHKARGYEHLRRSGNLHRIASRITSAR